MNPKRNRNRWLLRLAILPLIGIALLLWNAKDKTQDTLIVQNRSGSAITHLQVTVSGKPGAPQELPQGAEKAFAIKSDEPLLLEGKLEDGNMIKFQGKVPERSTHFIVLPGGGIKFQQADKN